MHITCPGTFKKKYPDAFIVTLVKNEAAKEILLASRVKIDKIIVWNIYKNIVETCKQIYFLRRMQFTYGVSSCITPVAKAGVFMKLIRPQIWVGLQKNGMFFDSLADKYHFVEANMLAFQEIIGNVKSGFKPVIYAEKKNIEKIGDILHVSSYQRDLKTIGINIGNADYSYKNRFLRVNKVYTRGWGIENVTRLINCFHDSNVNIILLGGPAEKRLLNYLYENLRASNRVINFVGKTSMSESIALLTFCDLVIGVDTGMQHVADALGIRTVSIFGPTNFKTHGAFSAKGKSVESTMPCQYCYGTKLYINCSDRKCLDNIQPEVVFEAVQQELSR